MKVILVMVLMGVLGVATLATGLAPLLDPGVECRGRAMSPGDTCTVYQANRPVVRDYAAQQAGEDLQSFLGIGFGIFFLLIAAVLLLGVVRYRREGPAGLRERHARRLARARASSR
jgi:tellurite resistance protein TehA-like permease